MHRDHTLVEARIETALRDRIRPDVYGPSVAMGVEAWDVPGEPVPVGEALRATYRPFATGEAWGPAWGTTWFRVSGQVRDEWAGRRVELRVGLGFTDIRGGFQAEGLVYDANGVPIKGISPRNAYVPIACPARGGEHVNLLIEAAANPLLLPLELPAEGTHLGDVLTAPRDPQYRLTRMDLAVLNEDVLALIMDIEVLNDLMHALPTSEPRRHEILRALDRMLDALDLHDVPGTAQLGRAELADVLGKPAHATAHRISAVGHAHIDTAWLWPQRETIRKASRTFANVTLLARDYPELVFACSQARQYAWVAEHQPVIFARIREAVRAGNWAPVGSMWVESDTNLPGGEALARQLIHGKRYFAAEFGVDTDGLWLPDSFGYTAALPQIARLAGVRWFLTQKLAINHTNKMPHHTFWWEGIDGSRLFTHIPPIDNYNAELTGAELAHAVENFEEKGVATRSLAMFGYGDGGGGPTREMLEKARRLRNLEGSPVVAIENPATFFDKAMGEYPDAPVWSGELYFERHRGTYTSQAKNKEGNRRCEHLLREAELWCAQAALRGKLDYPYDELDRLWKVVLLHQFHDILPGSSISWVHREAREAYRQVFGELEEIICKAASALGNGDGPAVFNAAPHGRSEIVTVPAEIAPATGAAQKLANGDVAVWASAPGLGVGTIADVLPEGVADVTVGTRQLRNGLLDVTIDDRGLLTSVRDLSTDRELIAPNAAGNLLQLHPDFPNGHDAWDLDRQYLHRHVNLIEVDGIAVIEHGPLLGAIEITRSIPKTGTLIHQRLVLRAGSRRLDVDTEIDWHESDAVLKAAFPMDIHAERESAEIQFGYVQRSTHTNTSWDDAKFERYHHRWLHVGEPGYGAALVNDAKYGHDVRRATRQDGGTTTTVRLTLLRAPHRPDPLTDQGKHRFTYSIRPGAEIADAYAEGYALNLPLRVTGTGGGSAPLISVDNRAVHIEAVKLADDQSGDVIVRAYEALGGRATTRVRLSHPVAHAELADLLERPDQNSNIPLIEDDEMELRLRPFQVLTLRLRHVRGGTSTG